MGYEPLLPEIMDIMVSMGTTPIQGYENVSKLSSGSLFTDWALAGGFPRGRVSILWGEEGSGKSTLFYVMASALMRNDPTAIVGYIDTEHALDPKWLASLGVDMSRFVYVQPDSTEKALNTLTTWIRGGKVRDGKKNQCVFSLICLDSVAGMASEAELAGEIGDATVANNARLIKDYLTRSTSELATVKTRRVDQETGEVHFDGLPPAVILTQQMRMKIGVMYGSPETFNGGRALKHGTSCVVKLKKPVKKDYTLKDGDVLATHLKGYVARSKVGPAYREFTLDLRQDDAWFGVDPVTDAVEMAFRLKLFENSDGKTWAGGRLFLNGEEVPLDDIKVPKTVKDNKTKWKLGELMYGDDDWFTKIETAVRVYISDGVYQPEEKWEEELDIPEPEDVTDILLNMEDD